MGANSVIFHHIGLYHHSSGIGLPACRLRGIHALAAVVGLSLAFGMPSQSSGQTLSLGQYGVFEVSGGTGSVSASGDQISGGIALGNPTTSTFSGTTVTGTVYEVTGAKATGLSSSVNVQTGQNLTTASQTAISASSTASGLTATTSYGNITGATTFTAKTGAELSVYDITSLTLSGANLTISGSSNQTFVFNITKGMTLSGMSILLTGGVTANNVLFNVLGGAVTISGAKSNGTILDLTNAITVSGSTVNGALVSEHAITLSGSTVTAQPFTASAPELPTIAMAGLAGLLVLAKAGFNRFRRKLNVSATPAPL
jgi:fibronectin-binding autotransporter adhesin